MSAGLPPSLWPLVNRLATGEGWPPSGAVAASRLVWQAEREGLLPLLFNQPALPGVVRDALAGHRALERLYQRRSEILEDALAALLRLLRGEPVVLLKGSDYRRRLYQWPALRPMQDVDLLVPRERIDAVCRRLEEAGLVPAEPSGPAVRVPSYHERVLRLGEVVVEIHHSFVQRPRHQIDYDGIWARRVPVVWDGGAAFRLADADALVYHALSLAIDEFCVPLVRYVDLWRMLEAGDATLELGAARARSWRSVRALYGALRQIFRLLPESRTVARAELARALLSGTVRGFLDAAVLPRIAEHGKGKNMSRVVELWRKLWLLDNSWRRARFLAYHFWAVLAGLWRRFARPSRTAWES